MHKRALPSNPLARELFKNYPHVVRTTTVQTPVHKSGTKSGQNSQIQRQLFGSRSGARRVIDSGQKKFRHPCSTADTKQPVVVLQPNFPGNSFISINYALLSSTPIYHFQRASKTCLSFVKLRFT